MSELTPIITKAVETATANLLDHFKERYGSIYFIPLGVNDKTPGKIAPTISETMETSLLTVDANKVTLNVVEDKIGVVFDAFVDNFFNSLSLIWKGLMKWFGLKLSWKEFQEGLAYRKANNPDNYKVWKDNWIMVLHTLFDGVIAALQANGKEVFISNGEKYFSNSEEAVAGMKLFN